MQNMELIQKTIEEDTLFYICDWSLNQKISQDYLVTTVSNPGTVSDTELSEVTDVVETAAVGYTFLPSDVIDYFDGVLQNIGDTDYYAYAYDSHYYLVYNLQIEEDLPVPGEYPMIEIYMESDTSGYSVVYSTTSDIDVPTPGYASFGIYSDFRSGLGHTEVYMLLFAVGFAVVYAVLSRFFSLILNLRKK